MEVAEFKERVLPLSQRFYQFARRILGNEHDAEDVTQEVFIKLWENRTALKAIRNLEAYGFRMTRNLCLDKLKKLKPQYYDDRDPGAVRFDEPDDAADPAAKLEMRESMEKAGALIDDLPELQRTLIQLREIEGLEYGEIAEITGMEINAIRVGISRARKKLREKLIKVRSL